MSARERVPTEFARALVIGSIVAAGLVVPSRARADRCCYAVCRSLTGTSTGIGVQCRDDDECPGSIGACMVWAYSDAEVDCEAADTCPVGIRDDDEGSALFTRLASDDHLVVTRPLVVKLPSGVTVTFEPRP